MSPQTSGRVCPECREPLLDTKIVTTCKKCLHARYMRTILARETAAWVEKTYPEVTIWRGRNGHQHVVTKTDRGITFCGEEAGGGPKSLSKASADAIPANVCTDCTDAYFKVRKRAAAPQQN